MKTKIRNIILHNRDVSVMVQKILELFDTTVDEERVEYWRDRYYTSNRLKNSMKVQLDKLKIENAKLKRGL